MLPFFPNCNGSCCGSCCGRLASGLGSNAAPASQEAGEAIPGSAARAEAAGMAQVRGVALTAPTLTAHCCRSCAGRSLVSCETTVLRSFVRATCSRSVSTCLSPHTHIQTPPHPPRPYHPSASSSSTATSARALFTVECRSSPPSIPLQVASPELPWQASRGPLALFRPTLPPSAAAGATIAALARRRRKRRRQRPRQPILKTSTLRLLSPRAEQMERQRCRAPAPLSPTT